MPLYDYDCKKCGKEIEVLHEIDEIENPNPDTILEITCCGQRMLRAYITAPYVVTNDTKLRVKKSRLDRNQKHKKKSLDDVFDKEAQSSLKKKHGYKS